jgi:hypothetical protein
MARHNGSESSAPPRPLGKAGKDLWQRINQDYVLADETAREILTQICEAQDHCTELCEGIKSEKPKMAPEKALQVIRQYRGFILRALERLKAHHNKNFKVLGRPSRSAQGYDPDEMEQMEETSWR